MAVNSKRSVTINLNGDIISDTIFAARDNDASPGSIVSYSLNSGDNLIMAPLGVTVMGVTIIPPASNLQNLTIKGESTDIGIPISNIDPTSIGFADNVLYFYIYSDFGFGDLKLIWT